MAAPNIVNVSTITGKTEVAEVTTTATAIVTNPQDSGAVYKVNALYVCNVDGENNGEITVDVYRGSTAYHIAKSIIVPANATLDILTKPIYLEENDELRLTANEDLYLEAVSSYEEIE